MGATEERKAERAMRDAGRAAARGDWDAAWSGYGIAMLCRPTVKAMIGFTDASLLMTDARGDDGMNAMRSFMEEAVGRYRLAVELSEHTGEPVPADVPAKIQCIETFLANPDPSQPPCQLVEDAPRTS